MNIMSDQLYDDYMLSIKKFVDSVTKYYVYL